MATEDVITDPDDPRLPINEPTAAPTPTPEVVPETENPFAKYATPTVRPTLAAELENPDTAIKLYSLTDREVGTQGPEAKQAFLESVFNRAAMRGMSLDETINDRNYFPAISHKPVDLSPEDQDKADEYNDLLGEVIGGSNVSNFATGNASGSVGFAGGPETARFGGEKFGIEGSDLAKMEKDDNPFAKYVQEPVSSKEIAGVEYGQPEGTTENPFAKYVVPEQPLPPPQPAVPIAGALEVAPEAFPEALPEILPQPDKSYIDLLNKSDRPLLTITAPEVKMAIKTIAPEAARQLGLNPITQNAYEGLSQSMASTLTGFTTPTNITLMGAMALAPELAGAQFIGRAASFGFSALSAKAVWDEIPNLRENPGSPEWWKHFGDIVFNSASTALGGMGMFRRKTPAAQPAAAGPGIKPPKQPKQKGPRQPATQAQAILTLDGLDKSIHGVTDATVMTNVPTAPAQPPAPKRFGILPAGRRLVKSTFQRWLGNWDAARQMADSSVMTLSKQLAKAIPDKNRRIAIYNWAQAGGDEALLQKWATSAPMDVKQGYKDALTLTQHEKQIAAQIRQGYDQWFARAQDLGMLHEGVTNYLNRVVTKRPEIGEEMFSGGSFKTGGALNPNFKEANQRFWDTMVDAERDGMRYNKDLGVTTMSYARSFTQAALDKAAIRQLYELNTDNGRPMVIAQGMGIPVGKEGNTSLLVQPYGVRKFPGQATEAALLKAKHPTWSDEKAMAVARDKIAQEYVSMPEIQALRDWQWVESMQDGTNILVRGDALVHKSIAKQIKQKFGTDRIDWLDKYIVRPQAYVKGSKLSLSLFHDVHERINAAGHLVNTANMRPLNQLVQNPRIRYGMQNGLQLFAGRTDAAMFGEGMAAHGWVEQVPGLGKWMSTYKNWLFEDQIPRMKGEMYLQAFKRNQRRYPKLNDEQLATLTARQANATFGEQNYRQMIGKITGDPRFWQQMQTFFLAPDFGVSKVQHMAQAATPYGGEQRMGLGTVAATLWTTTRVLNQLLDNDPHWEAENSFSIVVGDRKYTVRSLPGDLQHLWSDPSSYTYHRLSQGAQLVLENLLKRDYQGRPIGYSDVAKDLLLAPVPIPVQSGVEKLLPWGKQNRYEARDMVATAIGVSPSIYRDETQVRKLALEWKKQQPDLAAEIDRRQGYLNPPSKFNELRNALAHDDIKAAQAEYENLLAEGGHITERFLNKQMRKWAHAPFATGSKALERDFLDTLTQRQQELYAKARAEREKVYDNFQTLLGGQ